MRRLGRICIAAVMACVAAVPGLAASNVGLSVSASPMAARAYEQAVTQIRTGDWDAAQALVTGEGRTLVDWQKLRAGHGTFDQYRAFLRDHADWPGLPYLRRRGEGTIPETADPAQVLHYFADQQPATGTGTLRLIEAYEALGRKADAEAQAVLAWRTLALGDNVESVLSARYGALLRPHTPARLDAMLWAQNWRAAERAARRLDDGHQALALARAALARSEPGVDVRIEAVPAKLQDDAGLAYERFAWRMRKGRHADALELLLARSDSAAALGQPAKWASARADLARRDMRAGNPARAYDIAANHQLSEGAAFADLEWLAGYLALSYLHDPVLALDHFNRLRTAVQSPISLGRAGYWEGRALELMGADADAQAAYEFAAQYQTGFYGQLAGERLGRPLDPALTSPAPPADWHDARFRDSSVFKAAELLYAAGDLPLAGRFFRHLSESLSAPELAQLEAAVERLNEPYLSVRLGKYVARRGIVLARSYFPLHPLAKRDLPVAPELALSIARRESEFYAGAKSGVGARGLMQLMPATAKAMAQELNIDYVLSDLTLDPDYNATLGSAYLARLIGEFGNNPVLVAAGYNAGPSRPHSWIESFGDPRSAGIDPVDWIEHIPFDETRNYVMRVAESLPVYRARLTGQSGPIRLSQELRGR